MIDVGASQVGLTRTETGFRQSLRFFLGECQVAAAWLPRADDWRRRQIGQSLGAVVPQPDNDEQLDLLESILLGRILAPYMKAAGVAGRRPVADVARTPRSVTVTFVRAFWCPPLSADWRIADVQRQLCVRYAHSDIDLCELAQRVGLSVEYLQRRVRESLGLAVGSLLKRERIIESQWDLLHTGHRIKEVARDAGYGSESVFSRDFRDLCGMTPAAFRDTYRTWSPSAG